MAAYGKKLIRTILRWYARTIYRAIIAEQALL